MTEVTPHPLKTQGFHHFLFYCFTTTRLKPVSFEKTLCEKDYLYIAL